MIDLTTTDIDVRVTLDLSCHGVAKDTLATAIDITHRGTTEQYVACIWVSQRLHLVTSDFTTADGNMGITTDNSQLTTAIDAGTYLGITTDTYRGIATHFTTMPFIGIIVCLLTFSAAIDATIGVFHITDSFIRNWDGGLHRSGFSDLGTDGASRDGNRRGTTLDDRILRVCVVCIGPYCS